MVIHLSLLLGLFVFFFQAKIKMSLTVSYFSQLNIITWKSKTSWFQFMTSFLSGETKDSINDFFFKHGLQLLLEEQC